MPTIAHHHDTSARRRGAILTLALLALAFAGAPGPVAGQEKDAPSISAVESSFDFGTLVKGEAASHAFVLRNTGDEPVKIQRVAPSCGCTVVEFDDVIPAGGEAKVRTELTTLTLTGKGSSKVDVYVEGRGAPAATFELKYNVVSKLLAHPGYARWIYVQHEREGTIAQTVYAADGADFDVLSVKSPLPAIDVTFREATPEERREGFSGKQWVVAATLDSEAPVGAITGFIDVETTHPRQKLLQIPISGFVRPTLFVSPQDHDFGTLKLSAPRTATYQIRNFASNPIAITELESDIPGVTAYLEPIQDGREYKVIVRFDPAAMEEGPFDGAVHLTTDSEAVPTLEIDLEGTFVRQAAEKRE